MKKFHLLLIVCSVLLSGCAQHVPKVWTDVPASGDLLSRLRSLAGQYHSLDTEAKVSLTLQGRFMSTHQFLLVQKPERLRADVLTGFGQLVMQMAVDKETIAAYLNNTVPGKFYTGAATQENLSRFARIPLEVGDLVSFLLYAPPLIWHEVATTTVHEDQLLLVLSNNNQRQEVLFDPSLRVVELRYLRQDVLQLQVNYDDFDTEQNFPRLLKMNLPGQQTRITVNMEQPLLNPVLDDEHFRLSVPTGAIIETL